MSMYENGAPHGSPQRALAEHESHHPKSEHHPGDVGGAPPGKPASTKRIVAIITGVAVVLAALLVSSFLPRRATSRELEAEVTEQSGPPEVQTAQVVQAATGGDLTLPGTIQPLHEGAIYARV